LGKRKGGISWREWKRLLTLVAEGANWHGCIIRLAMEGTEISISPRKNFILDIYNIKKIELEKNALCF